MGNKLKNVVIKVSEPKGSGLDLRQARVAIRDEILQMLESRDDARIMDKPAGMDIALIRCTEGVKGEIQKKFPGVLVTDEVPYSLPKTPSFKFKM